MKERLFGLTGNEGNHGEDVKEYYFLSRQHADTFLHEVLYKYPQRAFPYSSWLKKIAAAQEDPEFELRDTGVFDENRYFDVFVEYAKASPKTCSSASPRTIAGPSRRCTCCRRSGFVTLGLGENAAKPE